MKHSGLLFLVIALMHSPHERNCVKIINDGFQRKIPNYRFCFDWVVAHGQMILDEGETLENLPPDIILQHKCPYYEDGARKRLMGTKNGSWTLLTTAPVKSCVVQRHYRIMCSHSTGRTYGLTTSIASFYFSKNCSMRLFLGEVAKINKSYIITNDHGLKGLTKEFSIMEYAEAPYYNTTYDAYCEEVYNLGTKPSKNGASVRRPRTDMILIFGGVAMTSAVLSF